MLGRETFSFVSESRSLLQGLFGQRRGHAIDLDAPHLFEQLWSEFLAVFAPIHHSPALHGCLLVEPNELIELIAPFVEDYRLKRRCDG
jgi:hypothetical protein